MVEHTSTTANEPGQPDAEPVPHTSFEELVAEPARVVSEATTQPVRIDGPNGEAMVLVDATAFDRLSHPESRARYAHEWSTRKREQQRSADL